MGPGPEAGHHRQEDAQQQQREAEQLRQRELQHAPHRQTGPETEKLQQFLPDGGDELHVQQAARRQQDLRPALPPH